MMKNEGTENITKEHKIIFLSLKRNKNVGCLISYKLIIAVS